MILTAMKQGSEMLLYIMSFSVSYLLHILRIDTGGWAPFHNSVYISETI